MEESQKFKDGIIAGVGFTIFALIIIAFAVSYFDKCHRITKLEQNYKSIDYRLDNFQREYYRSNNEIRKTIGLGDGFNGWEAKWS